MNDLSADSLACVCYRSILNSDDDTLFVLCEGKKLDDFLFDSKYFQPNPSGQISSISGDVTEQYGFLANPLSVALMMLSRKNYMKNEKDYTLMFQKIDRCAQLMLDLAQEKDLNLAYQEIQHVGRHDLFGLVHHEALALLEQKILEKQVGDEGKQGGRSKM